MPISKKKVFVAMSGGVDSSVAAFILKNQDYDVTGVFMRCWSQGSSDALGVGASCSTEQDAEDARRVAEKIGIPFYVWDFEEEYRRRVVDYMTDGYRRGLTPNPDMMCNREIKFGIFFEKALRMGADYVATGHYVSLGRLARTGVAPTPAVVARLPLPSRTPLRGDQAAAGSESFSQGDLAPRGLFEAQDKNKDQSYFLWILTQEKLRHCLFPIGDYLKPEVREMARRAGLPTANKKDSQGICFLGKITLSDFLAEYIPERSGTILTDGGEKIGEHRGAEFYTIGQRHGLDLKSKNSELGIKGKHETKPHYVSEKNVATNTIVVAEAGDPALYKKEVVLGELNFINSLSSTDNLRVQARIRYRQPLAKAILAKSDRGTYRLTFDAPQKFVASGQSAVFYIEDPSASPGRNPSQDSGFRMLGGGIIL